MLTFSEIKYIIAIGFGQSLPFFSQNTKFPRRDSMGNFFRRMLAFMLGIVFTITSLAGGLVGGAYYAYKNVNPIEDILAPNDPELEEALGDLYGASIEQLVDLIYDAMNSEDDYTFKRLEEEYGLNLKSLLEKMGANLDNVDTSSTNGDWAALEGISILSAIKDPTELLETMKLRSLYLLVPAFVEGKTIDDLLSKEAQAKLGDYTIAELISADESTGELGIVTALKGLKIGALLPSVFEGKYDVDNREYTYEVKADSPVGNMTILNLIGDLNIKGIMDVAAGGDFMEEMISGDLSALGQTPIAEILGMLADVAGEETAEVIKKYVRVFGDTSVADLFEKNEAGEYTFVYENLLSEIQIGYLLGMEKTEDGWVNEDGTPAEGLLEIVAGLDIGAILRSDGDVVAMINAAVGDLSLMDVYETIFGGDENAEVPALIERLGTIKVSDILGDGQENIVDNLKENLKYALDGFTLRDALYSFVDDSVKEKIEDIVILDAFLNIPMDEFIRDEYTVGGMIDIVNDAIGHVTIGDIIGAETDNEILALVYDYKIGGILNGVKAIVEGDNSYSVIIDEFLGQYLIGDIFGAALGYTYDEAEDNWGKDGKYVGVGLVPLLKMPVAKIAAIFDKESDFDIMDVVGGIQLGDVVYTALQIAGVENVLYEKETADRPVYVVGGDLADFEHLSQVVSTLSVKEIYENYSDGEWWINRIGQIRLGDGLGYVLNNLVDLGITASFNGTDWVVEGDYLVEALTNALNTSVAGIYNAVKTGDVNLILDKVFGTLGSTNLGDVAYMVLDLAGVKDILVLAEREERPIYVVGGEWSDFEHLSEVFSSIAIYDIYKNYADAEWWIDTIGQINLGDGLGYVLNNLVDVGITATYNGSAWVAEGDYLTEVVTNVLNTTAAGIYRAAQEGDFKHFAKKIVAKFGDTNVGEFAYAFAALIGKPHWVVKADNETGFAAGKAYGDLVNITEPVFALSIKDIAYNFDEIDWWFDNFGEIKIGDAFAFFINRYAENASVVLDENGNWLVQGDFAPIFTSLFNITINDFRNPDKVQFIRDTFGGVKLGDILDKILHNQPELLSNPFMTAVRNITVNDIIDLIQAGSVNGILAKLQTIFYGVTFGDIPAMFGVEEAPINLLAPLFAGKISNLLSALRSDTASGVKEFALNMYGNFSLANAIDEFNLIPEAIRNNAFIDATLGLDVNGIYNMITAENGLWNELIDLYAADGATAAVTVKDIATIFYDGSDFDVPAIAKIYAVELAAIFTAARDGQIGQFALDTLGNISVGDIAEKFYASNGNEFLEATYSIDVQAIVDMIGAEDLDKALDVLRKIYAGVTVEDAVFAFGGGKAENAALAKVYDTQITFFINLITVSDVLGAIWGEYDDVTLGDAIGHLIETNGNNFLNATLSIGVDHVFQLITAEDLAAALDIVAEIYDGVTVGSLIGAFGVDDFGVAALTKIYDTQLTFLLGLVESNNVVADLRKEFGDIAIGDVLEKFLPSDGNKFLEATYAFNVENVFMLTEATGLEDVINQLKTVYDGVTVGDILALAGVTDGEIPGVAKLLDTTVNFLLGLAITDNVVGALWAEFDDITVGDFAATFYPTNGNLFLEATYAISLDDVFEMINDGTLEGIVDIVKEIYSDVYVGDVLGAFGVTDFDNAALAKIYATKLTFLLDLIFAEDVVAALRAQYGNITVGDALATVLPANGNKLLEATYTISVENVFEIVEAESLTEALNIVKTIYDGVAVADVLALFGVENVENAALNKVLDTKLNFFVGLAETNDVLGAIWGEFDDITVGDAIRDFFPTNGNLFLEATYAFGVDHVFQLINAKDMGDVYDVIRAIYKDITVEDLVRVFTPQDLPVAAGDKIYGVKINDIVTAIETNYVIEFLYETFGDVAIGDMFFLQEGSYTVLGCTVGFNPISGKWYVGEGTIGIEKPLEYILNLRTGRIYELAEAGELSLVRDELAALLGDLTIGDVANNYYNNDLGIGALTKLYAVKLADISNSIFNKEFLDFGKKVIFDISVGDLAAWALPDEINENTLIKALSEINGYTVEAVVNASTDNTATVKAIADLFITDGGEKAIVGDILALAGMTETPLYVVEKAYNAPIHDVIDAIADGTIGEYALDLVNGISVGNVVADVERFTGDLGIDEANPFMAATFAIDVETVLELTKAQDGGDLVNQIKMIYDGVTLADVIGAFGVENVENNALVKILDTPVNFLLGLATTDNVVGAIWAEYDDITVGDAIGQYVETNGNLFLDATLGFSVDDVFALINANGLEEILEVVDGVYDMVTIGDIVDVFGVTDFDNAALAKIYDVTVDEITDFATTDDVLGHVEAVFGDLTVGDTFKQYLPEEIAENAFIDATLGFSVADGFALADAQGTAEVIDVVKTVYDGVEVMDIVALAGVETVENVALNKILDTKLNFLIGLATTEDVVDALWTEFGEISLDDAMGQYVETNENPFLEATLSFSVGHVQDILAITDVNGAVDFVDALYDGVTFGDTVGAFGLTDFGNAALAKIYDTTIDGITDIVMAEDPVAAVWAEFEDITLADTFAQYLPEEIAENGLVAATLAFSVKDAQTLVNATAVDDILGVVYGLYDGVTVGDAVSLVYSEAPVNALNTIYAVEIIDLVDAILNEQVIQYLYNTFGDVMVGDLFLDANANYNFLGCTVGYDKAASKWVVAAGTVGIEQSLENILNIKLSRIYDIVASPELMEELQNEIAYVLGDTTVGSIATNAYDNPYGIGILDTVYGIVLKDVTNALFEDTIAEYGLDLAYGVSVGDLVAWLLNEEEKANKLVAATLAIDVETVVGFVNAPAEILKDLGTIYKEATLGDALAIAGINSEDPAVQEISKLNIGTVLKEAYEGKYDTALATAQAAYEALPENVQTIILVSGIAAVAVTGTILYFADNPLLCQIVEFIAGENDTWGKLLESYGVVIESKGNNSLMNTFLGEGVVETFDATYDFVGTYKDHITLGNLMTAYLPAAQAIEGAIGMEFVNCANGYKFDNEFAKVSDRVFNLSLGDFMTSDNKFVDQATAKQVLVDNFGDVTVGDIAAYFVSANGNWFMEKTYAITAQQIKDIIDGPEAADRVAILNAAYDTVELGHLLAAFGVNNPGIQAVTKIFDTDLSFFFNLMLGAEAEDFINEFGDIAIGDVMESFLTANGNRFLEKIYAVNVAKIYELVNAEKPIDVVKAILDEVTVGDVLALVGVTDLGNAALAKILATEINFIIALTETENVLGALWVEYGDLSVGDIIENYLPTNGNKFLEKTYTFSFDHVCQMLNTDDLDGVLDIVKTVYEGVSLGDALALAGLTSYPVGALQTVAATPINFLLDLREDNYGGMLYNQYGGLKIGDFLAPYGGELTVAGFTVSHNELIGQWTVTSEAGILETALTNLVNVTLSDLYDLIKNFTPENALSFLEKVLGDTQVGEVAGLIYANDDPHVKAIDTVYAIKIADVLEAAMGVNGATFGQLVRNNLGEVSIADCIPEGGLKTSNDLVLATLSLSVNDALHVYDNKEDALSATLTVLADTYKDVKLASVVVPAANRTQGTILGDMLTSHAADKIAVANVGELFTDMLDNGPVTGLKKYVKDNFFGIEVADFLGEEGSTVTLSAWTLVHDPSSDRWEATSDKGVLDAIVTNVANLTLEDIYELVSDLTGDNIVTFVEDIIDDTKIGEIASLVYANDDPHIKAIDTVYDITVVDTFEAIFRINGASLGGLVRSELGEVTIGDCIPDGKINSTNEFVVATLGLNVNDALHVYDNRDNLIGAALEVLERTYETVQIESLITPIANRMAGNALGKVLNSVAADKIGAAYIGEAFTDMLDNGLVAGAKKYIKDNFFDIAVADILGEEGSTASLGAWTLDHYPLSDKWVATSDKGALDTVVTNVANLTVADLYELVANLSKANLLDFGMEILGETKVGEIAGLAYANEHGIKAIDTVYEIKVADVIGAALGVDGASLSGLVRSELGEVTIADCIPEGKINSTNEFVVATLGLSVNDALAIYDGRANVVNAALKVLGETYKEVQIESLITPVANRMAGNVVGKILSCDGFDKIGAAYIGEAFTDMLDNGLVAGAKKYIKNNFFGISLGDFASAFLSADKMANPFISATLSLTPNTVLDIVRASGIKGKAKAFMAIYDATTFGDVIDLVPVTLPDMRIVDIICDLNINDTACVLIDNGVKALIKHVIGETVFGDYVGEVLNSQSFISVHVVYDEEAGQYTVVAAALTDVFERFLNFKVNDFRTGIKSNVLTIIGDSTVGEYLTMVKPGWDGNQTLATLGTIKVADLIKVATGTMGAMELIGDFQLKQLIGGYIPGGMEGKLANGVLMKAALDMPISNFSGMSKAKIFDLFGEYTLGDALSSVVTLSKDGEGKWTKDGKLGTIISKVANFKINTFSAGIMEGANQIMAVIYVGDAIGCKEIDGKWYTEETVSYGGNTVEGAYVPVIGINKLLASKNVKDLLEGGLDFNSLLGDLYLGELLGFTVEAGVWYEYAKDGAGNYIVVENGDLTDNVYAYALGSACAKLEATLSGIKVVDLISGDGVGTIMDTLQSLEIGYVLGYTYDGAKWMKNGSEVEGLLAKLAGNTIGDLTNDFNAIIGDWKIGEVLGYTETAGVWYKNGSPVTGITAKLAAYTVNDLTGGFDTIINGWKIGEVLGYTYDGDAEKWYNGNTEVKGVAAKLAGYTVGELTGGFDAIIGTWKIGEVLGYTYTAGTWYNNATPVTGVAAKLAGYTVNDLTGGFDTIIGGWKIGEVLGYTYDGANWMNGLTPVTGITAKLADYTVDQLTNGFDTIIDGWKIGEIMGYTYDGEKWMNGVTPVTGVLAKLSGYTVGQLSDFNTIINSWTLTDVLGDVSSNKLLSLIANEPISNIATAINGLSFGQIMGYAKNGSGNWVKDANGNGVADAGETAPADELTAILCEYSVADISTPGFTTDLIEDIKTGVTVGTIFGDTSSSTDPLIKLMDSNWTIAELPTELVNTFKNGVTVGQMVELGVFGDFFEGSQGAINRAALDSLIPSWTTMQMDDFFTALLAAALM